MTTLPPIYVTTLQTVESILSSGTLDGYTPGAPSSLSAAVDGALCTVAVCDCCGFVGLEYRPYYHAARDSYRIIASCRQCGQVEEL